MRFLEYLQEEYYGSLPSTVFKLKGPKNISVEVFKNPSVTEMKKIVRFHSYGGDINPNLRFLIDIKSESVYVWSANTQILHDMVWHKLKVPTWSHKGYGELNSAGKIVVYDLKLKEVFAKNEWLGRYFETRIWEEYLMTVPSPFGMKIPAEVFEDPSKAEIRSAGGKSGEIRFLIDCKKKKFYVWFGWGPLHHHVIRQLGIPINNYPTIRGMGDGYVNGKIKVDDGELWNESVGWIKDNESWIAKYCDIASFKKHIRHEIDDE